MLSTGLLCYYLMAPLGMATVSSQRCRCFRGDECWPSSVVWSAFNASVDGRLIATVPLAASCHDPNYQASGCKTLRSEWLTPEVQ